MATLTPVNLGTGPDTGTGDPLRTAFGKLNDNDIALNAEPSLVSATPVTGVYALANAVRSSPENVVLTTNADNTDIEVPASYLSSGQVATFQLLVNNFGCTVSINTDPSGRVLNGVTNGPAIALGPAGSTVWIIVLPGNIVRVEGETAEARTLLGALNANGQMIYANLVEVVASVSGTLTNAHLGRLILTSGNIAVPTTAGFQCLVKAGGAHTVTFNATVSPAMITGNVYSIIVQSATVIIMTPGAAPVAFV